VISSYTPSEQTISLLSSLDAEYRDLLDLRERVRKAEAAAAMGARALKKVSERE
jgi:hypothetical protein